jgi:hypothetical protein
MDIHDQCCERCRENQLKLKTEFRGRMNGATVEIVKTRMQQNTGYSKRYINKLERAHCSWRAPCWLCSWDAHISSHIAVTFFGRLSELLKKSIKFKALSVVN